MTKFRLILYDYLYVRRTWREDKTGRAEEALADHARWEQATTLGLGRRLGPCWYPADQLVGTERLLGDLVEEKKSKYVGGQ